jgi:hypothetical protein
MNSYKLNLTDISQKEIIHLTGGFSIGETEEEAINNYFTAKKLKTKNFIIDIKLFRSNLPESIAEVERKILFNEFKN